MNGRKVFFIQPNSVIQHDLVAELIRQEYEVLLVADARQAKKILLKHPDCLAFLNLDEGYTEAEWEAFIVEVQADPALAEVKLGILTYNPDPVLARTFLLDHSLPCGFIKLSLSLAESTGIVLRVLEANEAKGRRQFLRVHCGDNTKLNLKVDQGLIDGRILDISSVGMACVLHSPQVLAAHTVVESVQLQLKGSLCLVNGVIMGSRPLTSQEGEGSVAYIILFDPKTPSTQREKIRAYIQWSLQAGVEAELRA